MMGRELFHCAPPVVGGRDVSGSCAVVACGVSRHLNRSSSGCRKWRFAGPGKSTASCPDVRSDARDQRRDKVCAACERCNELLRMRPILASGRRSCGKAAPAPELALAPGRQPALLWICLHCSVFPCRSIAFGCRERIDFICDFRLAKRAMVQAAITKNDLRRRNRGGQRIRIYGASRACSVDRRYLVPETSIHAATAALPSGVLGESLSRGGLVWRFPGVLLATAPESGCRVAPGSIDP